MKMFADDWIRDNIATDELDDLLDSHHTETVTFVRDDSGTWFARISHDFGAYSSAQWRDATDYCAGVLDAEVARTRPDAD